MIVETADVLTSGYGVPRASVVDGLIAPLRKANIETFRLDKDLVLEALVFCRASGGGSFADALVWAGARSEADAAACSLDEWFPDDGIRVLRSAGGGLA